MAGRSIVSTAIYITTTSVDGDVEAETGEIL
jgi:hypothetical protein